MTGGQVVVVEDDVGNPEALAARLSAELRHLKPHSAVALVTAPEGSLGRLRAASSRRTRLYFATDDDPSVDLARSYIERLMPDDVPLPDPAILTQMYRNVRLRVAFLREHETWTTADVARFAGSRAKNVSATANRWRSEGAIFAIAHDGQLRYPAFQFDIEQRRPKAILAEIRAVFESHQASGWEIALWFAARHPQLRGTPLALLDTAPAAVLQAARATYTVPV